jgi:rhodanese-related sulfurtransferase
VLTGDSLFVNDVARPDLAIEKREGAQELYRSMRRLVELGDGVEVFPGHTGGSLCGSARMSETTSSTIGYERGTNPMLLLDTEQRFVEELVAGLPPQPPNFRVIAELNREGSVSDLPAPDALDAAALAARIEAGALVIDGRDPAAYDAAHIPGSVGIAVGFNGFGTKVAWVAGAGDDIVLVADDDAESLCMARLLHSVGLSARGMLSRGFASWTAAGMPVERFRVVDPDGLAELWEGDDPPQILDVREDDEWAERRIPGSVHVPYHDLGRDRPPLDPTRPVAVICSTGRRSAMAAGLVRRAGFGDVIHVTPGGVDTWAAHGHPVEQTAPAVV